MADAVIKVVENKVVVTPFGAELLTPLVRRAEQAAEMAALSVDPPLSAYASWLSLTGNAGRSIEEYLETLKIKGDPGGNIMAVGSFATLGGLTIPLGTEMIRTSGYDTRGIGAAYYVATATVGNNRWRKQSANGRWFELVETVVNLEMFGGVGGQDCQLAWDAMVAFMKATGAVASLLAKTYFLNQITLFNRMRLRGAGASATVLRPNNSAEPSFVTMEAGPVRFLDVGDFQLLGDAVSNPGQNGMSFVAAAGGSFGGLMDSAFSRIIIRGFDGKSLHVRGNSEMAPDLTPNQFVEWASIDIERPTGAAGHALYLEGQCEHFSFINSRFDGPQGAAAGTNVYVGRVVGSGDRRPNSLLFLNCTSQNAALGFDIDRCEVVTLDTCWFEDLADGAVSVRNSARAVNVQRSSFLNAATSPTGKAVMFRSASQGSVEDNFFNGANTTHIDTALSGGVKVRNNAGALVCTTIPQITVTAAGSELDALSTAYYDQVSVGVTGSPVVNKIISSLNAGDEITMRLTSALDMKTTGTGANLYLGAGRTSRRFPAGLLLRFRKSDTLWQLVGGELTRSGTSGNVSPAALAPGQSTPIQTIGMPGVKVGAGQRVEMIWNSDLLGCEIHGYVSAADTISWYITNPTNGTIDLDVSTATALLTP